jgi:hypothetical protein
MDLAQIVEYVKILEKRTEELNVRLKRVEAKLFPEEDSAEKNEEKGKDG